MVAMFIDQIDHRLVDHIREHGDLRFVTCPDVLAKTGHILREDRIPAVQSGIR